ncbi:MAG TPA: sarcosine oxidase subunit gamma family protein [Solirubrobacteraceae bacterium]
MSLAFLRVDGEDAIARSPMEHAARRAGAQFEVRDGWSVAVSYGSANAESVVCLETVGWADVSHLGKLELQATEQDLASIVATVADGTRLELGTATRAAGAWWCPLTRSRALVICEPGDLPGLHDTTSEAGARAAAPVSVVDVSTTFAAMTLVGPLARELFARFCAADLRPQAMPVGGLRPGSIARQPGLIVREGEARFSFLFGWAIGHYMWTTVQDAGSRLGGSPVGLDALALLGQPAPEVPSRA